MRSMKLVHSLLAQTSFADLPPLTVHLTVHRTVRLVISCVISRSRFYLLQWTEIIETLFKFSPKSNLYYFLYLIGSHACTAVSVVFSSFWSFCVIKSQGFKVFSGLFIFQTSRFGISESMLELVCHHRVWFGKRWSAIFDIRSDRCGPLCDRVVKVAKHILDSFRVNIIHRDIMPEK